MTLYGQEIRWTRRDGGVASVRSVGHPTAGEAQWAAVKLALNAGWTNPKWWEWWRRKDTKIPAGLVAEVQAQINLSDLA
jgi:hypothetical protein